MNPTMRLLWCALIGFLIASSAFGSDRWRTNFVIKADSKGNIEKGTPCYVVYENAEGRKKLLESGASDRILAALNKKGYLLVDQPDQAAIFVKVSYLQGQPYQSKVSIAQRPQVDFSNSISTTNVAAKLSGRYSKLYESARYPIEILGETILGPDGKLLDTGKKRETGAEISTAKPETAQMIVYPLVFQVAAWKMETENEQTKPINLWTVTTEYGNTRTEELSPQLNDIAKASIKYFGKELKDPKTVARR